MVGNEILTGKIEDTNTRYLARRLFELGIALRQVVVCPDEMDIIVRELNQLRAGHDIVFTSGGVGPTHDDITIDAVAAAFGRPVVESPEIAAMIRAHFGDIVTPAHLRMANMPEGAELVRNAKSGWPTVLCGNVYILPGVPEIFERKLDALRERLDEGQRFFNQTVYTHCDEGEIAALAHGAHVCAPHGDHRQLPGAERPGLPRARHVRLCGGRREPSGCRRVRRRAPSRQAGAAHPRR
jgi:molybdenum cofactor synthesis domain-containing protein